MKCPGKGFASMDPAKQKKIASQGGRAAHASGNAHQFTSEEARAAGRKRYEKREQPIEQPVAKPEDPLVQPDKVVTEGYPGSQRFE